MCVRFNGFRRADGKVFHPAILDDIRFIPTDEVIFYKGWTLGLCCVSFECKR